MSSHSAHGPGSNQWGPKPKKNTPTPPPTADAAGHAATSASATPFATSAPQVAPADQARLAMLDHATTEAGNVSSVRKARYDARAALAAANAHLEGREGMSKDEQVAALRSSADAAMQAALTLAAAAEHAEQRDLDAHQQAKSQAGDGALPAISGDGGFVTPDQAHDDAAGWTAAQTAG